MLHERPVLKNSLPPHLPPHKEEESKQKESKIMAGFWTTFLQREPIVVWSCALGAIGAALPVCVPPIRNMLRADQEPTRPPSAQSVVEALRGGKS
ncbi:unknown protein [Bathycoccus prasinos]|uniref:Uncharacterized protein n=1 Tax=Bathycoccus prasinos TaxID=41875 RepID=K8F0C6_9CHLO|nr:unknown protein [Bathycoccus prasinos]CCO14948.1 unknown protein [Bathycoccus prasinos]|eukprot:XP_007514708.1 unknown protein [Bathycoccus prasinos]